MIDSTYILRSLLPCSGHNTTPRMQRLLLIFLPAGRNGNSKGRLGNPQEAAGDITGHLHTEVLVEGRAGEVSGFAWAHTGRFGVGSWPLTLHHSPRVLPSSHQLVPNFHLLRAAHHSKGQMSLKQSQGQGLSGSGNTPEISLSLSSPSPWHRSRFHEFLL